VIHIGLGIYCSHDLKISISLLTCDAILEVGCDVIQNMDVRKEIYKWNKLSWCIYRTHLLIQSIQSKQNTRV
jgi:hypothetical protein